MRGRVAAALAIAAACACNALSGVGDLDVCEGVCDAGASPPPAAPPPPGDDAGTVDAPPDAPFDPGCDSGPCGVELPLGFSVVLFGAAKATCPPDSIPFDVLTNAVVGAGACTCDTCVVKTNPSCDGGSIVTHFDNAATPTCGTTGVPLVASSACQMFSASSGQHEKLEAPPAGNDGTCTSLGTPHANAVTTSPARICAAPSCAACNATGADFPVCIAASGDRPCPASLPAKQLVGLAPTVTCGVCGTCTVTATCAGAVTFYGDPMCGFPVGSPVPTGTCVTSNGTPFQSYRWSGMAQGATCTGSNPPPGVAGLLGEKTICCR